MNNYENIVCKKCGNFFTTLTYDSGSPIDTSCTKCKNAIETQNAKLFGSVALIIIGIVVAAFVLIFSKSKSPKQTAIILLLILLSVFILVNWGFIWFVAFAILCFGWNYYKKNQLVESIEADKTEDIVQDDTSSK